MLGDYRLEQVTNALVKILKKALVLGMLLLTPASPAIGKISDHRAGW
jgi:hypothetical protein